MLTVFFTPNLSLDINCDFYDDEWAILGNVYTCSVKNLITTNPNENVTNIIGTHDKGKTNEHVKKLNIQKQTCEFIPRGFEKFFPNLEGLRVAQSELTSLSQSDLSVFPKLRNCDMFNNFLSLLEENLFAKNPHLEYLYFGDNRIRGVGYNILKPLSKLKKAIFQGNFCVNKNADSMSEVGALQKKLNDECTGHEYESLIKKLEEEKRKEERLMKKNEEEERKLNELVLKESSENEKSSSVFLWLFFLILFLAVISLVYYFALYKRQNKGRDSDSVTGFLPPYSEMAHEPTAPNDNGNYVSGATNLSF